MYWPLYRTVDVTAVTQGHTSVMFEASLVKSNYMYGTVQGNPSSIFNGYQSVDAVCDNGVIEGESHLLDDSEDDLEFPFRFILCFKQ